MKERMFNSTMQSPIGDLLIVSDGEALTAVHMAGARHAPNPGDGWIRDDLRLAGAVKELEEYFAGARTAFDVPLRPRGTAFQLRVWEALREIPFGETLPYGELARHMGRPGAARAIGAATGRNPIAILIPCHRVVGADGSLVGFGGGLDRKRALLELETRAIAKRGQLSTPSRLEVSA